MKTARISAILTAAAVISAIVLGTLQADAQTDTYNDDRAAAAEAGLTLGPVPDGPIALDKLPDLVPIVEGDGTVLGYAYPAEIFADELDSRLEVIAYGVYQPDGKTLVGHVIPGRGFVKGDEPITLTRRASIPDPLG